MKQLSKKQVEELTAKYSKLANNLAIATKKKIEIEDELLHVMHELEEHFKSQTAKEMKEKTPAKA